MFGRGDPAKSRKPVVVGLYPYWDIGDGRSPLPISSSRPGRSRRRYRRRALRRLVLEKRQAGGNGRGGRIVSMLRHPN